MQDSGFKKKDRVTSNIPQEQFVYTRGGEHKVMKKVVNSVLASTLALTVAPMAFAATDATTAPKMDAGLEKTVKRLEALGLVAGYGNGDFGVDKTITRAEFATLIVRMRGLEQGAKLAQYNSNFTDVKTADWFSGFVNVASGQEIIKGFPDKSFKPQNQVTYAEAVTMVVRALGYEPSVKGTWPNNMIAKASELNIAKNITSPNNAATRGDIFKMMDNALRVHLMEQVEYGTDIRFNVTDETLLTKYLNVIVRDMEWAHDTDNNSDDLPLVTNIPAIGLGSLKSNEVTLNGKNAGLGNTTYKVADGINPNEFDGQRVQVWIKDDRENTIVWMEGSEDQEVVMDRLSDFYVNSTNIKWDPTKIDKTSDLKNLKVTMDGSGKTYKFTEDTEVTYNFQPYSDAVKGLQQIMKDGDGYTFSAKVVLNDKNEISYIHVIDDQTLNKSTKKVKYGSEVIEKVDADKKAVTNLDGGKFNDLKNLDEGSDFLVFLDGKPAKLSDLKPMDVYSVYYADGQDDKLLVFANRTVVEGKVDRVTMRSLTDNRLQIGDKTYRIRLKGTTYSDDANKDVIELDDTNQDKIKDLDGEEVKLYLDASGRIRHIETKDNVSDRRFKAIVTKAAQYSGGEYNFSVMSEKGKKFNVSLDAKDIKDSKGKEYDEDSIEADFEPSKTNPLLLEVTLDSKGEVDKVKVLDTKLESLSNKEWDKAADEDDDLFTVGGKSYDVTSDTAVFDMTGNIEGTKRPELKRPAIAKFKDIADKDDVEVLYALDGDEVDAFFVVDGKALGSDYQYGQVLDFGRKGGADSIKLIAKDGDTVKQVEYAMTDDSDNVQDMGIKRGDFIAFQLNSDKEVIVDDIEEVVDQAQDIEKLKVMDSDNLSDAGIEDMVVAQVSKVDKNKVTVKDAEGNSFNYFTMASTAYFNAYDLEEGNGIDDGDYVVMIKSDTDGDRFDYVLYINSADEVKDEDLDLDNFKKQMTNGPVDPGTDPVTDLVDEDSVEVTQTPQLGGMLTKYTFTGKGAKGATMTITVGDGEQEGTVDANGNFTIAVLAAPDATKGTIVATLSGKKETQDITIK